MYGMFLGHSLPLKHSLCSEANSYSGKFLVYCVVPEGSLRFAKEPAVSPFIKPDYYSQFLRLHILH